MTLPPGWRLRLDPGTRRLDGGTVLIGGAPFRLLRLNAAAARVVDHLAAGEEVGTGSGTQAMARRLLDAGLAHPRPSPTARTPTDVTVVVPHFGDPQELALTLAALVPTARTIVVDDASPDRDGVATVAARHGAELVRIDRNGGPAAARNAGWPRATTELVAFVDRGCVPAAGWLTTLLPHLDDPAVAIAAPRITSLVDPGLRVALAAYERARPSLDRGPDEAIVRPRSRVPFVPSTALLVRRTDLVEVDGFDEELRVGEDVDLVWRLAERGRTVRYVPAATVAHGSRTSAGGWLRQRFDYGTSAAPLAVRHGAAVAPLAVNPWTAAAWGLDAVGAPLLGTLVAAGSTAALAPKLHGLAHPWQEAARLAGLGHVYGGRAIADALRRPWWPFGGRRRARVRSRSTGRRGGCCRPAAGRVGPRASAPRPRPLDRAPPGRRRRLRRGGVGRVPASALVRRAPPRPHELARPPPGRRGRLGSR